LRKAAKRDFYDQAAVELACQRAGTRPSADAALAAGIASMKPKVQKEVSGKSAVRLHSFYARDLRAQRTGIATRGNSKAKLNKTTN
jgi:hypothetical protein